MATSFGVHKYVSTTSTFPFNLACSQRHRGATIKTYSRRVNSNSEGPSAKRKRVQESSDIIISPPSKIPTVLSVGVEELSAERKRDEERHVLVPSSPAKINRSSIYNYFKPIQPSSSPLSQFVQRANPQQPSIPPRSSPNQNLVVAIHDLPLTFRREDYAVFPDSPDTPQSLVTQSLSNSSDLRERGSTPPSSPHAKFSDPPAKSQQAQNRPRRRLKSRPTLPSIPDISSKHRFASQDADESDSDNGIIRGISITVESNGDQGQKETPPSPNVTTSPAVIAIARGHQSERARTFTQVQLDLGQRKFEQCKDCRFLWNPSINEEEDRHKAVHTDWHFGKRSRFSPGHVLLDEYRDSDHIHIEIVDLHSPEKHKLQAEEVLRSACEDMGGLCVTSEALWKQIPNPQHPSDPNLVPQYKVLLYFVNRRSAAVLLAKRISFGGPYYHGPIIFDEHGAVILSEDSQTQEWVSEDRKAACWMSVDLIWVRTKYQRKGRATEMVEAARTHFIAGLQLKKRQIAFSRLTDKGVKFARKYCKDSGLGTDFLVDLGDAASVIRDGKLVQSSIS
jgi:hypothetical protein